MSDVAHLEFNSGVYDIKDTYIRNVVKGVALSLDDFPKEEADATDSERIQRAIAYLNTIGGGTLLFPAGEYEIGTTLKIYDNIVLKGFSNASTIFKVSANIPFVELYDATARHDNMGLCEFEVIRTSSETDTPLIEMSHWAYSILSNISLLQENNQQTQPNCVGVHLDSYSYYNTIRNVQIRQFHTGILAENAANGNMYIGGSCISCGAYGVHIIGTNSNVFFGHAVELGGNSVIAYFLEHRSLFNTFVGCRVENVGTSYRAVFEAENQSSFNNLVVGGLDYSTNGAEFTGISNEIVTTTYLERIENWSSRPAFKLGMSTRQTGVAANTPTKLSGMVSFYDRTNSCSASESRFTAPTTGLYTFYVGIYTVTEQSSGVKLGIYVNGTELNTVGVNKGRVNQFITSFSAYLEKGDYVEPYVILSTTSDIYQGGGSSYFTGAIL